MHPEQENVFEIRLNEDGVVRLKQILTLTRLLLIIGLAEIFVFIGDGIVRQLIYHGTADTRIDTTYSWMMTYFYPIYSVCYAVFYIAYLIYFFKYSRRANASIRRQDSQQFNHSFRFLASCLRMAIVVVVLNLVIWTVFLIMELGYYKNLVD